MKDHVIHAEKDDQLVAPGIQFCRDIHRRNVQRKRTARVRKNAWPCGGSLTRTAERHQLDLLFGNADGGKRRRELVLVAFGQVHRVSGNRIADDHNPLLRMRRENRKHGND